MTGLRYLDLLKLIRFGAIGLSSSLLYGLLANLLLLFSVRLTFAHCLAYALAIPFSYSMQRGFTFRSSGSHFTLLPRFLISVAFGFLISNGIVAITAAFRLPSAVAITAVIIVVPLLSYLCMNIWVFRDHDPDALSSVGENAHD